MYFQTKIAVFILVVTLNLQIIPAAWITWGKLDYSKYDNATILQI